MKKTIAIVGATDNMGSALSNVAGDDDNAVNQIWDVVGNMGLNPLAAAKLLTLENMQLLLIQLNMKNHYNWRAGWKTLH